MTTTLPIEDVSAIPYHKIQSPFKRCVERGTPNYNKPLIGAWSAPEFAYLSTLQWRWTEKVDGTNVRVFWDGVQPQFFGRTDKAQLPSRLLAVLEEMFPEMLMEEVFGAKAVTLYGEGYGGKIQKGSNYRPDENFILFDVKIGRWWLDRDQVNEVARSLLIESVPEIGEPRSVWSAIEDVKSGVYSRVSRTHSDLVAEGLVGTPVVPLFNRAGERTIMKVKTRDFYQQ